VFTLRPVRYRGQVPWSNLGEGPGAGKCRLNQQCNHGDRLNLTQEQVFCIIIPRWITCKSFPPPVLYPPCSLTRCLFTASPNAGYRVSILGYWVSPRICFSSSRKIYTLFRRPSAHYASGPDSRVTSFEYRPPVVPRCFLSRVDGATRPVKHPCEAEWVARAGKKYANSAPGSHSGLETCPSRLLSSCVWPYTTALHSPSRGVFELDLNYMDRAAKRSGHESRATGGCNVPKVGVEGLVERIRPSGRDHAGMRCPYGIIQPLIQNQES